MFPTTKTDIAKMAVSMVVALKATQIAEQQVAQHTELNPESITVKVGATVAGQLVARTAKPLTDATVDTVVAYAKQFKRMVKPSK